MHERRSPHLRPTPRFPSLAYDLTKNFAPPRPRLPISTTFPKRRSGKTSRPDRLPDDTLLPLPSNTLELSQSFKIFSKIFAGAGLSPGGCLNRAGAEFTQPGERRCLPGGGFGGVGDRWVVAARKIAAVDLPAKELRGHGRLPLRANRFDTRAWITG